MLERERQQLVDRARRLRPDGLVVGASGNLSVRCGDLVAVTPTAVDYDALEWLCALYYPGHRVRRATPSRPRS